MTPPRTLHFVVPGPIDTPTGGYGYDRRLMREFRTLGWNVRLVTLPAGFPTPDHATIAAATPAFAAIPNDALVLVDGLAYSALPELMAAEAARLALIALIHHPLGDESGLDAPTRRRLHDRERAALAHARAVVCTSPATAARLTQAFAVAPHRLTIAPPGTDPASRAPGTGSPLQILSIGSLIPRKRHDVLIAALADLRDIPWTARILGADDLDPACAADLRTRAHATNLGDLLALSGRVADTRAELARADIFALASEYEGYGMAFAEALSQGLPIVACRSEAVSALVPETAGALVPPGDPAAFAAALRRLLEDPAHRRTCAEAAFAAGQGLPRWSDTAAIVARTLETLPAT